MRKQDLQNEQLDRIGNRLINAGRVSSDEIEEIVTAPQLFNSVKARIKAEEASRRKNVSIFNWMSFGFWNWQKASAAIAFSAILFFGILGVLVLKKQPPSSTAALDNQTQPEDTTVKVSQSYPKSNNLSGKQIPDNKVSKPQNAVQIAVFKSRSAGLKKSSQKKRFIKQNSLSEEETEGEFFQLTYAGNLEQTTEDEQIIRVELPRSSLVALGVSAPAENENEKVKTDLLIGSDGVVRAVRLIK